MKKLILSLFVIMTILSCSEDVQNPNDELIIDESVLGHDNWKKVSFIFTEGELKGDKFIGYENDTDLTFKTVQEYEFKMVGEQVVKNGGSIKLITGKTYGLEIKYFNSKNVLINKQFTTAEMAPIHQHFFITDPEPETLRQKEKNTIDYVYRDTKPIDKMIGEQGVTLREENDPIGLKGHFNVFKKAPHVFDLNVVLVHILGASKLHEGKPYPFYAPSLRIIGTQDLNQKIPMKIIGEEGTSTFLNDIATEYGITKEQVSKEISERKLGNLKL